MKTAIRLLAFLKPFTGWVALSVLLAVATIASNIGLLGTSAYLIGRAALHPSIAELEVAIVGVRFFGIGRGVFRYLERLVSHSVNFRLLGSLRVWFYQKLEPLAPARLQDIHSGDLLSRSVADIETLQDFYLRAVAPPVTALVVTLGMGLFVGQFHPGLAGVLLGGLLLSGVGAPFLSGLLSRGPAQKLVTLRADLSQALVDGMQGMPDLLVFNQDHAAFDRFHALNARLAKTQRSLAWSGAIISGMNLLIVNLTLVGILLFAIPLTSSGSIDGVILAVLSLVTLASFEAVSPLGLAAHQLQSSLQAARRLFEVADQAPAVTDPASSLSLSKVFSLSFRDLTFSYPGERNPALNAINFELPAGKRLGIVGPSGAGKSSLLNLVLRFWNYDHGIILLEDQEIKRYAAGDIRQKIAVISQDTYISSAATLRDNLLLARPNASDVDLLRALEQVNLTAWLHSLPHGLDTWLGEHAVLMSGGERQRLAVARAVLRDASLYLLDEPTNHLDPETEASLVKMLLNLTQGKSVLWVTHSLKGMESLDEILVLQEGSIQERGTHHDLLSKQGLYARMSGTFKVKSAS
ncbi:MAG TPA: thiol reductant ABC exporter subunit CydC [Anaerolineaceae bacterium]